MHEYLYWALELKTLAQQKTKLKKEDQQKEQIQQIERIARNMICFHCQLSPEKADEIFDYFTLQAPKIHAHVAIFKEDELFLLKKEHYVLPDCWLGSHHSLYEAVKQAIQDDLHMNIQVNHVIALDNPDADHRYAYQLYEIMLDCTLLHPSEPMKDGQFLSVDELHKQTFPYDSKQIERCFLSHQLKEKWRVVFDETEM